MPRYDYRCEAGHKYELQQPFGSPSEHPCQRCGKTARRVLYARPLVFKGSGFYATDSRGSSSTRSSAPSSSARSSTPPDKAEKRAESNDRLSKAAADD